VANADLAGIQRSLFGRLDGDATDSKILCQTPRSLQREKRL
jgi:hypothetical protein